MSEHTKEDILALAEKAHVKFVRLQFTDILGIVKNVAIPVSQLEKALNDEIMFDGSSIEGFTRIEESDMNLRPDLDTWTTFPWRRREQATARMICDVYRYDGQPFEGDPRYVLKKVLREASEMGYTVYVGPECEFFLFRISDTGEPTTRTHDRAGYFDLAPIDRGEDARRDIVLTLEEMGFEIEASHHEVAGGQHEIDFKATTLTTADRVATPVRHKDDSQSARTPCDVHAQADLWDQRLRHAHPRVSVQEWEKRVLRPKRTVSVERDSPSLHRRSA